MSDETHCIRCAYGTVCNCAVYTDWIITPPSPAPKMIRGGGYRTGYRDGWKTGYAKGFHDARTEAKVA